jgi:hypothetical protein
MGGRSNDKLQTVNCQMTMSHTSLTTVLIHVLMRFVYRVVVDKTRPLH